MMWTDQPAVLEETRQLLHFAHDGRILEIRFDEKKGHAYLTVGNLFGSQTALFFSLPKALKAAQAVVDKEPMTKDRLVKEFDAVVLE